MLRGIGVQALFGLLTAFPAFAQSEADAAQQFLDSLRFREGQVAVPAAHAQFKLGPGFRYLEAKDAQRVLEDFWGNPPDDSVLGLIVPAKTSLADAESWAVVVTYSDEGFVSDEDANSIDYTEMLEEMKAGTEEENEAREQAGYDRVDLIGWAEAPHYDASDKKLYWAKELHFGETESNTVNYDIRVLGRHGYLSLNAIGDMQNMSEIQRGMQSLLPMAEFDSGYRYADFNESTDKLASYGLAALVGGGLAAKTGLLAKIGALLLAGKKVIVLIIAGLAAVIGRIFKKKN